MNCVNFELHELQNHLVLMKCTTARSIFKQAVDMAKNTDRLPVSVTGISFKQV